MQSFFQKPHERTATRHIKEGYLLNSGNFMFGSGTMLDDYRAFEPQGAQLVAKAGSDLGFATLASEPFAQARAVSIDFAVMEKTKRAAVVPASFGWSNVGQVSLGIPTPRGRLDGGGRATRRPGSNPIFKLLDLQHAAKAKRHGDA